MSKKTSEDCRSSRDPCCSRTNDENTQILIDSDNEDEFTSSGISEDEEEEDDGDYEEGELKLCFCFRMKINQIENILGNILQPINQSDHRNNIDFIQVAGMIEVTQMNNDHLLAQTMAVLAAKHQHTRSTNSTVSL
jgi:hypothetical protein